MTSPLIKERANKNKGQWAHDNSLKKKWKEEPYIATYVKINFRKMK